MFVRRRAYAHTYAQQNHIYTQRKRQKPDQHGSTWCVPYFDLQNCFLKISVARPPPNSRPSKMLGRAFLANITTVR